MGYLGNCRNLRQTAALIQARLPVEPRARCGAAAEAACHRPSDCDSPFRLRPNDAVPSGLYGYAASAHRATARRGRKLSALLAALLFAASGAAQAKTIPALSPSLFDVTKAIGSAVDGDTVIIPAGTATWTSQLAITKAITLMGKTTTDSLAGTAVDQTIIQYNLTNSTPLIAVKSVLGKSYRISGFTFRSISTVPSANGFIVLLGQSQAVRLDNCHFALTTTPAQAQCIRVAGGVYGVADHNVIEQGRTQTFGFYNGNPSADTFGNTTWSQPTAWGSSQFFFVEDNYVKNVSNSFIGMTDGDSGCRFVIRHNHCYSVHIANHGTEGAARGGRAMEIYGNDFHNAFGDIPGGIRSGCLLFYSNTWAGSVTSDFALAVFRVKSTWPKQQLTGWQGADGSSPWDVNDTEGNGTYVAGHAPFQYFPRTPGTWATAGVGTTPTKIVDDSNPGWKTNQWKNFGLHKKDDNFSNEILDTANSNTNLVDPTAGFCGHAMTWAAGSQYQIHRVLVALDQQSRGQGDLVKGSPGNFFNSVTGTRAWPHQVLDPVYSWNNYKGGGMNIGVQSMYSVLVANRDYYNQAAAVGGVQQTGVGVGTLSNRPASGKNGFDIAGITPNPPGTAYWATDVPSINGSTDKGALYVWRGGAWVLYYQPYTYPHPLVRDLLPPSNLQVVP